MDNFTAIQASLTSPLVVSAVMLDSKGNAIDLTNATAPSIILIRDGKVIGGKACAVVAASQGIVGASFTATELQTYGVGVIIYRITTGSYPSATGAIKLS